MPDRILLTRAARLARLAVATTTVIVGALLLAAGRDGLSGPTFAQTDFVPWWSWGAAAALAGAIALVPRLRVTGLLAVATWYATWGAVLVAGALSTPGAAWYPAPIYAQLAGAALLAASLEHQQARRG